MSQSTSRQLTLDSCLVCGTLFASLPWGKPQRYCTKECYRRAASRRRMAAYVPKEAACAACGMPCRRWGKTAYCGSEKCREERDRRLALATKAARTPERNRANYQRNKHLWRVSNARRQARIDVQTIPGACTEAKIQARMAHWGNRCWVCGCDGVMERDHVKPLSKGGLHVPANIRPICRSCNRSKKDAWPFDTARRKHS